MDSKNRIRDPREEILLETNFDEDGVMTRSYNNNTLTRQRSVYRSEHSIDRFSEASIHGNNYRGWFGCLSVLTQDHHRQYNTQLLVDYTMQHSKNV